MKGVDTFLDPFQMIVSELNINLNKCEIILSENAISLTGNKDHPNACLCYMLYCLTIGKHFNLAYYIANRMVSATKSADMTLPYRMLLTRLFEHVRVNHPYSFSNELYLVDHVMIPLSEKRVFRFKDKGKRPRLPTLTPSKSESFDSPSPTPHQRNDPVNNYTLDPIPYINQLPAIEGGESLEFKQTKGLLKCLFYFLSKKKASSANSSTQNPPKKIPRTDFIDISSNESSPIQNHLTYTSQPLNTTNTTFIISLTTTLDTTLALIIPPPTSIQTTPTLEPLTSPLAPRDLTFSTPPSSPLEPHPYLSSLNEIPPRSSNPLPQVISQGLSQTLPQPSPMDFKPTYPPIISRSKMSAQLEPSMTRDQIQQDLNQLHNLQQNIQEAIQKAQLVQDSLIPPTSITNLQIPPSFYHVTTSIPIPPFRTSLPPSNIFVPLD
ncbi:hypothetical protein Tco_1080873 [Tanacetum coccineum]|uniref:Uncharacterized protein n=1 Tax=Tanacetum coccineum TaxID=301880 RepID=A0ABQ5HW14_9ASTR